MIQLTDTQLAGVEERMHDLPADQPARFSHRVDVVMNVTGRDRGWSRARAAEIWPGEHDQYVAVRNP